MIDSETSIKNRGETAVGTQKSDPFCPANKIVMFGERHGGKNIADTLCGFRAAPLCLSYARSEKVLLVGHNLPFDLKYMWKTWDLTMPEVINNIYIWDTQQVAYLLSGQTHMYPSLDELTKEVGGVLKDEKIKDYWNNDVDTELIPAHELGEYLEGDLENTEKVFRYQYELVSKIPALFNLVKVKMDDLLCTTMMEMNGMHFDLSVAHEAAEKNDMRIAIHTMACRIHTKELFHADFQFNPMSNEHVSLALYGGKYSIKQAVLIRDEHGNILKYKTGKRAGEIKTRLEDVEYTTEGMKMFPAGPETSKKGVYSVSDEYLAPLMGMPFVNSVLQLRELTKENETYYRGYSKLVWPDNKIHPSINHCSTRTGRQSCTKPNLQNVTRDV